ncbi:MAG: hypothetical protein ORN57_03300 [Alphaproteobacteria bacterium]|nr:hypothetical protein [Alphaproteobacteria bacterium]
MTDSNYTMLNFCNSALLQLGGDGITSLSDDKLEAKLANQLYPLVRDNIMTAHPWRFLLKEKITLPLATSRNSDWQNLYPNHQQYQLPDNLLLLLSPTGGAQNDYMIAGNLLLSRQSGVTIRALLRTDETTFPPFFAKLLVDSLMAELALPITEDISRADFLQRRAAQQLSEAKKQDSKWQGRPNITARFLLLESRHP